MFSLAGKKALVIGIANQESIAFGCTKAFRAQVPILAITYQNDETAQFVRPLAETLATDIVLPLDEREDGEFGRLFDEIRHRWGQVVDICLHSIAFCPKEDLHARVVEFFTERLHHGHGHFSLLLHSHGPPCRCSELPATPASNSILHQIKVLRPAPLIATGGTHKIINVAKSPACPVLPVDQKNCEAQAAREGGSCAKDCTQSCRSANYVTQVLHPLGMSL